MGTHAVALDSTLGVLGNQLHRPYRLLAATYELGADACSGARYVAGSWAGAGSSPI